MCVNGHVGQQAVDEREGGQGLVGLCSCRGEVTDGAVLLGFEPLGIGSASAGVDQGTEIAQLTEKHAVEAAVAEIVSPDGEQSFLFFGVERGQNGVSAHDSLPCICLVIKVDSGLFRAFYFVVIALVVLSVFAFGDRFQQVGKAVGSDVPAVADGQLPCLCSLEEAFDVGHLQSFQFACRHVLQFKSLVAHSYFVQHGLVDSLHILAEELVAKACILLHGSDKLLVGLRMLKQIGEQTD